MDKETGICRTMNIVYKNVCLTCKQENREAQYIGETSRTIHERMKEHARDLLQGDDTSHMLTHLREAHQDLDPPTTYAEVGKLFQTKVVRKHTTALSRMIHEAVTIREAKGVVLNSKEEYNRCLVPTLTTTGTEKRRDPPKRKTARDEDQAETRRKREGGEIQKEMAGRTMKRRRTKSPERVQLQQAHHTQPDNPPDHQVGGGGLG